MDPPTATIVFSTLGKLHYGFDIFYLNIDSPLEHRLTDGININYNAQFLDDNHTIIFISERTGFPQIFLTRPGLPKPQPLTFVAGSLFHDRPIVKNGHIYFISAHEQPQKPFTSWTALYSTRMDEKDGSVTRLTPLGSVDYSPALSQSGRFVAVASYGSRPWGDEYNELYTDIVVYEASDPSKRAVVCERGGWPTWSGESVLYFHRKADDGWWSIFRVDFPENMEFSGFPSSPSRVTPPGVHCFTPAALHDGKRVAVATRRLGNNFRHIEIFDTELKTFQLVTKKINPNFHHYNPFVSPDSRLVGYHRFRGESPQGESVVPHMEPVVSPAKLLRMLRVNGYFPSFSPNGDLIALNLDFVGLRIVKSDGSKRWNLIKDRMAFCNSWSRTEKYVIYTSVGPIFDSVKTPVQIARIKFDPKDLKPDCDDISCDIKILTRDDTGNNAFPSCSPDGKHVVFRSGRTGHKNLFIFDAVDGEFNGSLRQLTEGPWIDTMPCWSPKGDLIAFSSNRHNPENVETFSIYVIKPDGSDLRRIHVAGLEGSDDCDRERINHVCFSEDGEWLLFVANLGGVISEPVSWPNQFQPFGEVYVVRLDGSGLRRLTWNAYENGTPTWHFGNVVADMDRLCLKTEVVGDPLKGEFEEPNWITCDI